MTALRSLEIACDTLLSGKAKVMIDDISEGSYEFANMKATSNAETEFAMGRKPTEMSRPATTARAGASFEFYLITFTILIGGLGTALELGTNPWYSSFIHFNVSIPNISISPNRLNPSQR